MSRVEVKPIPPPDPGDQVSENTIQRVNLALGNLSRELHGTSLRFVRGRRCYLLRIDEDGRLRVERAADSCGSEER